MQKPDDALEDQQTNEDALRKVHERAMLRFDDASVAQTQIRAEALQARRFVSIPGAQWDGPWGEQWDNAIKVEINKVQRGVRKIEDDYRQNRIVPDFRPAGSNSDQDTADMLDGLHRADSYHFKAQQARDNAFSEALKGGFGAYRLTTQWADAYDKDSDEQRVNPGMLIADADQRVFFDPNSKLYDKSDARFAFVLTEMSKEAVQEDFGKDAIVDWPENRLIHPLDWFRPDSAIIAEYYVVEDRSEKLLIFTMPVSGEEQRFWSSEIERASIDELLATGWQMRTRRQTRCRIHKYVMSGAEILQDQGFIAGDRIPIVPVYGNREYIDGVERFTGLTQSKMDAQRLYNSNVSKLAETNSLAPREVPIFAAEQMPPNIAALWARQNIERHAYALVNPLVDPQTGQIVSAGPIGKIEPPQLAPVTAALLEISNRDLTEDDEDGADEVKANTSAEAMDIAATRVDAKSGIYLDNMRQSVQCEGEIYQGMAREVYFEPGRVVETMDEDGDDGEAVLHESFVDDQGRFKIRNNLQRGRYKVIASVTEATATRRDKTVRSSLYTADVASKIGDNELAQAALITAVMNQDGEGMDDLQKFARKKAIAIGLTEPNEEEQQAMAEAEQDAPPDPTLVLTQAQAEALQAGAQKDMMLAAKAEADTSLSEAKVIETLASARQKGAQAQAANDDLPRQHIRFGRELSEPPEAAERRSNGA